MSIKIKRIKLYYSYQAPEKYVNSLLDMFDRFTKLIGLAFNTDPEFLTARDKAFQFIVNDTSIFKLDMATSNKYHLESGGCIVR